MKIITVVLILSCTLVQAQITKTIIHETGGNTVTYQLSSLDSIVYDLLGINMILHETGGNTVSYAIANIDSVTYDTTVIVSCGPIFTDARNGEIYPIIQIGNQCWMAENLRYDIPNVYGSDTMNPVNPSVAYGRLYSWETVMNGTSPSASNPSGVQGICPNGWHLPSDAEWNEMELVLGMLALDTSDTGFRGTHGTSIKSTIGWTSGNGTNASNFNAFPVGLYSTTNFHFLGTYASFWSSTEYSVTGAWVRFLDQNNTGFGRGSNAKTYLYPCRCLKD